ncbi:MAG: methionyl-tRNA formyltransferase [Candidatus Limnocylindrales bacterium]
MSDAAAEGSSSGPTSPESVARVIFFGSGRFAVPILDALTTIPGVRIDAVVSAPDRPVGRKALLTATPVTARARELDLPVLQPVRVRSQEAIDELRTLAPDLVVLADYGQLIPRVLLDLPPRGFLNLHPSALPRHRGAAPIAATILAGDTESAVTLMVLTEEMDAGPIVASEPLAVLPDDTAVTLEERAAQVAAHLLRRALPAWLAGCLAAQPQAHTGVTVTRPLRREDGRLDPGRFAIELERQVRAYQPWPGAYVQSDATGGERLIVWKARVAGSAPLDEAGRFVSTADGGVALATREGRLVLELMQRAGGRPMEAREYLRGHPDLVRSHPAPPGAGMR